MRAATKIVGVLLPVCFALNGCFDQPSRQTEATPNTPDIAELEIQRWTPIKQDGQFESWVLLATDGNNQLPDRLAAGPNGLWLIDSAGEPVGQAYAGRFAGLDARPFGQGLLTATLDTVRDQPMLVTWDAGQQGYSAPTWLPTTPYPVESLCFYADQQRHLYLFLVGEEGSGQQWLVAHEERLLATPKLMRTLHLPVGAKQCAVNDQLGQLFINEEDIGVWAYPANPETNGERAIVDLVQPYGGLTKDAPGLAASADGVVILDGKANLHRYTATAEGWQAAPPQKTSELQKPERLAARTSEVLELLIADDANLHLYQAELAPGQPAQSEPAIVEVPAQAQTLPVPHSGDAADDPAIWVNPSDASQSRILGTDKRGGLGVYNLDGQQLQYLPVGRINNVDLRDGFSLNGETVSLAVASNRDSNSLELFSIGSGDAEVRGLGRIPVPLNEIYGLCMTKGKDGDIYAIANDKDGRFVQYLMEEDQGQVNASLVREFSTATQPEGCVADDQRERLFIGEEGVGVWSLSSDPQQATEMSQVISVDGPLHADVEGMAIFESEQPYLVLSSQGNDSYLVLDAEPPYQLRGAFRVGINVESGIDGVSETDGLEVSSMSFGSAWPNGMLVVQDGRKRMPEGNQNFKMIAWHEIAEALNLP
ncbi:MAG: phytase [Pseudomonas neustonica]